MKHVNYCAAVAISFYSLISLAQDAANEPVQLDAVTVEASPFGRAADDLIQPTEVLHGRELDRKRKSNIGETLEGELGVSTTDFGPGVGRPVIRGQGGPRVLVLENGIGSMDVSNVSADHAVSIDPANAEQVEIVKGPATLIFGNGASAGIVNVVNKRLPTRYTEGFSGSGDLSYGSNGDEKQAAADLNFGINGFVLHADSASRKTDDFDIPGFANPADPRNEGTLSNSAVDTRSGALSLSHIAKAGSLGAAVSSYKNTYGLPQEEGVFIDLKQTRFDAQGTLNNPFSFLESLRARIGVNDYTHTEFEDAATPGTVFDNQETEARFEARHQPLGGFKGVIGVQVIDREFSAVGDEAFLQPVQTRSAGLFVVEEHPFSWGRVEAGVRVDRVEIEPAALRSDGAPNVDPRSGLLLAKREDTPLSLSLGSLVNLDPQHHLRLGLTHAQRAPVAEELFAFGPHLATTTFERGNSGFNKETANNFDLSVDRHGMRWTWKLNVYYNRINDYLYLQEADANLNADGSTGGDADGVPDGTPDTVSPEGAFIAPANLSGDEELILVDYRQADAKFYGLEGETAYRFIEEGAWKLNGRLFSDLVRGELESGGDLPRITPARYGVGFDASIDAWSGELVLTRIARQSRISSLETPTAGFNLLSVDLGYTLRGAGDFSSRLYLRGRNLLDEDARRHTSFIKDAVPQPGRTVIVGVRVDF